jgi:hypothetical protein
VKPSSLEVPDRLLLAGWVLLALLPSVLAWTQLGRLHPDEVYQFLEPAYARVHGYGVLAWEWKVGLRNWGYPLLIAACLKGAQGLGLSHPVAYRALAGAPQFLFHLMALRAVYRWTARHAPLGAITVTALVGLQGVVVAYAGRTLGESLSVDFLWLALEMLDRPCPPLRSAWSAGALFGLAGVVRYASGAAIIGVVLWLAVRRDFKRLGGLLGGGALVLLALGLLDLVTWGHLFQSLLTYLRFNVLSSGAALRFGEAPPSYYIWPLLASVPLWVWAAPLLAKGTRPEGLGASLSAAAAYAVALLLTPHKEERFVYPLAQLLVFAAAPLLATALTRLQPRRAWVTGALAASLATWVAVPDVRGDEFRALVHAAQLPGTSGLLIVNEGLWGSGGFFYLGKRIPWLTCDWPRDATFQQAIRDSRFNRAITFEGRALTELEAAGFHRVRQVGRETELARD